MCNDQKSHGGGRSTVASAFLESEILNLKSISLRPAHLKSSQPILGYSKPIPTQSSLFDSPPRQNMIAVTLGWPSARTILQNEPNFKNL